MKKELDLIESESETPENCKPVSGFETFRFNHYKKTSNQFKNGVAGRWQIFNGYGWSNCEAPDVWVKDGVES
tara:strand:+ start:12370 stop:12585 length:216 start_codon:yes stop_codon:yes gene_type:complete